MLYPYESIWDRAIRFAQELSMINSYAPAGKHEAIAYVEKLLRSETPAQVQIIDGDTDEPFLIASLKPEGASFRLLLEGHLDVVSPEGMDRPFDGIIEDGWLLGRGTNDMKGGAAALLSAFIAAANAPGLKQELYLMYSTDEEYAGEEIKKALSTGLLPKVDLAMIAEPTNQKLINVHKGEAWAEVCFFGKSAHSSTPWQGQNAICMASRFIEKLQPRIQEIQTHATEDGIPTMNVGVISGGSAPNVVPPFARLNIDIRYLPGEDCHQYEAIFQEVLASCQRDWPEMKGEIRITGNWNALQTDKNLPLVRQVEQALAQATGKPVEYTAMNGWGEGGYINMFGIPTLYYGPGESAYSHKPDERIAICRIPEAAKAYYAVLQTLCF